MRFRTEIRIDPSELKIDHKDKIMMVGSCFSDNVGKKLQENKFAVNHNPLGIAYNPYSLCKLMSHYGIKGSPILREELWRLSGVVSHRDFHSSNNCMDEDQYLNSLEKKLDHFCDALLTADWLFITLGTAWVYRYLKSGKVVSNCHKLPASNFNKEILPLDTIVRLLKDTIQRLQLINPDISIVLTVSPVRHLKDGMVENNRSKARLIEASHLIIDTVDRVQYFPSYEIMNDDLRNYRFYGEDMVHPTDQAIDYIWKHFTEHYFDKETKMLLPKIQKIRDARNHRLFQSGSDSLIHFTKKNLLLLGELKKKAPYIDWSEELAYFNRLKSNMSKEK